MPGLDFVKIAEGMGCAAARVTKSSELADALKHALAYQGHEPRRGAGRFRRADAL
jgi:benzoylformate decarboxylase